MEISFTGYNAEQSMVDVAHVLELCIQPMRMLTAIPGLQNLLVAHAMSG